MKMNARELRRQIGELSFPYWVRCWRDGDVLLGRVGRSGTTDGNRDELMIRLAQLGYASKSGGKPGTSGYNIVQIVGPLDPYL